jgi:hypothetical protein
VSRSPYGPKSTGKSALEGIHDLKVEATTTVVKDPEGTEMKDGVPTGDAMTVRETAVSNETVTVEETAKPSTAIGIAHRATTPILLGAPSATDAKRRGPMEAEAEESDPEETEGVGSSAETIADETTGEMEGSVTTGTTADGTTGEMEGSVTTGTTGEMEGSVTTGTTADGTTGETEGSVTTGTTADGTTGETEGSVTTGTTGGADEERVGISTPTIGRVRRATIQISRFETFATDVKLHAPAEEEAVETTEEASGATTGTTTAEGIASSETTTAGEGTNGVTMTVVEETVDKTTVVHHPTALTDAQEANARVMHTTNLRKTSGRPRLGNLTGNATIEVEAWLQSRITSTLWKPWKTATESVQRPKQKERPNWTKTILRLGPYTLKRACLQRALLPR